MGNFTGRTPGSFRGNKTGLRGQQSKFHHCREEKATKAIQRHHLDIKDVERNPQTDEAFLLLGKARYFDERYIPALEAFNYILNKYNESDKLNKADILA